LGLLSNKDLRQGDLILVSHPLGIVFGPRGQIPSNEVLAQAIRASGQLQQDARSRGWLRLLSGSSSERYAKDLSLADALLGAHPDPASDDPAGSLRAHPDHASDDPEGSLGAPGGRDDPAMVSAAVNCNCYGEVCEDVAVAELRVRKLVDIVM